MTRTRIVMQALQEIDAISPIMERGTNSFAGPNRLLRAMDVCQQSRVQARCTAQPPVDLELNWDLCKWWRHDFKTSFGGQRGTSAVSARSRSSCHKLTRYGCLMSPQYEASQRKGACDLSL